ncbi:MAG: hypothetical protein CO017_02985, partial [Zetaproteobacteria bacterium CG_4_8_14_3_um_filter_59_5]
MSDNERDFTRVQFSTRAEVDVNGHTVPGDISDISMNGIYLRSSLAVSLNDACEVRVYLGETEPLVIHAQGLVARCDDDGFAVHFTGLYCESYDHLKQIILLNAASKESAEQELVDHLGIAAARSE